MKCLPALSALAAFGFVACETMTGPIATGDFDPLRPPGGNISRTASVGPTFKAGQFVQAVMDNTAFFKVRPKGDADADKLLTRGTSMKYISTGGNYVKVELDSGEVGWIPTVMVEDPNAAMTPAVLPTNAVQVYPPLPGSGGMGSFEPLPPIDPTGLPPEGAIPTIIDPDSPSVMTPVPPVTPTTDTFPTPIEPPVVEETVPLPPNDEDLKAAQEEKGDE